MRAARAWTMHKTDPLPMDRQGIGWRRRIGGAGAFELPEAEGCPLAAGIKKERHDKSRVFLFGGEKGIRTLDTFIGYTRFPIVRLRPAQPSLHILALVTARYILAGFQNLSSGFLKKFIKRKKKGERGRDPAHHLCGISAPALLRVLSGKCG